MPVVSINIGPKRVHLTAYCPADELGLLACDYVLQSRSRAGTGSPTSRGRPAPVWAVGGGLASRRYRPGSRSPTSALESTCGDRSNRPVGC